MFQQTNIFQGKTSWFKPAVIGGMLAILTGCVQHTYIPSSQDPGRDMRPEVVDAAPAPAARPEYRQPQVVTQPRQENQDQYAYVTPDYPDSGVSNNPAARRLIDRALEQRASGDLEAAAATLERALRVAPNDPEVYYELASIRLSQQNYAQAEQLARRGLSLTRDPGMRARLQSIIDQSAVGRG
ncbi:tetratricopeptide repeat protein [Spartinivicinus poritis]|uniref:Tetratricopeptide repeat protein n=1 Tax=Spartinivicinus poritis TaxID=2994640 RepID=A0ABT5U9Y9_9GAMM|nr:tetratricopeptide repeat protein [Spartinivicinus sp. A2-2]MDE1463180.1 tetratricopeptide repeat protein [Spartinivicinus sp. A2-2]